MKVREILANIEPEKKAALMTAFNTGKTLMFEFTPGCFVGVNVQPSEILEIVDVVGLWSCGRLRQCDTNSQ